MSLRRLRRAAFAVLLAALSSGCSLRLLPIPPTLPDVQPVERTIQLDQGWSDADRERFHHISQGTATVGSAIVPVPYAWFVAFEQPSFSFGEQPLLRDPAYMSRFGFIPSPASDANPHALPVGFARDPEFPDPYTDQRVDAIGITCAGCHTAEIHYRGTAVRVEGGPAMLDQGRFRTVLALTVALTRYWPGRFGRFADRLLGEEHSDEQEDAVKKHMDRLVEEAFSDPENQDYVLAGSTEEGFGRLDAIGRIGNFVFATEMDKKNAVPLRAPVNYPHLWDTSWFDWVQYNGSIRQPMIRNAGEALGVRAFANLTAPEPKRFQSSVRVDNLYWIETLLAGSKPFPTEPSEKGLRPPPWPSDLFGEPDPALVARGEELYQLHCKGCHLPPTRSPEILEDRYWEENPDAGERYLKLRLVPLSKVGTDPNQALGMRERRVDATAAGVAATDFGAALAIVTEKVVEHWYDQQTPPTPPDVRRRMNGNRDNLARSELAYKARPLDGIWATAPYLHNGSVPNLYLMLSPASERPKSFYLGSREFDPLNVGFEYQELEGGFRLEVDPGCDDPDATGTNGNCNTGHEFRDGATGRGVLGAAFSDADRRALVEFLKTL